MCVIDSIAPKWGGLQPAAGFSPSETFRRSAHYKADGVLSPPFTTPLRGGTALVYHIPALRQPPCRPRISENLHDLGKSICLHGSASGQPAGRTRLSRDSGCCPPGGRSNPAGGQTQLPFACLGGHAKPCASAE